MKEFILDYLTALGIGGILISSFIEALGVPFFPGGIMVILAGFLIPKGYMSFPAALLATASGFITGSLVAYFLGAKLGGQVFERGGRWLKVTPVRLDKARLYLSRSAPGFVIFGRFIPGISNLTPYLAGVGGLRVEVFFALTAAFAFAWAALYLSLGMLFGQNWSKVAERIQPLLLAGAMAGLGFYFGFFLRRKKG
ncbi:MAG: VTT domain-containing protein [Bacillota bacterium]|nr:VTT domain-containing protein [Thermoanaerobacteraceae bacterium]